MVTFAQAQERGERWVNADMSAYETREVKVREFDLGFVVWSEPREDGPTTDDGSVRLVIARDSGEATLWPGLPIGELIRRYEEEYGTVANDAVPDPPQRLDLEATSFLLSPPQWLQDAADRMGIPDHAAVRRGAARGPGATGGRARCGRRHRLPAAGRQRGARGRRALRRDRLPAPGGRKRRGGLRRRGPGRVRRPGRPAEPGARLRRRRLPAAPRRARAGLGRARVPGRGPRHAAAGPGRR